MPEPRWKAHAVAAQHGDLSAFDARVGRFRDMAIGCAYSLLGDFQLAEDAFQEALVQAFLHVKTLGEPHAFPAWLRRIVVKHCDYTATDLSGHAIRQGRARGEAGMRTGNEDIRGQRRWSASKRVGVVLQLLRAEDLETVRREVGVAV